MSEKSMSASTLNGRVGDITDAKCLHMVANSKAADLIVAGAFVKNMRGSVTMPNELKLCPFCGRAPETRVTVRDKCIEITISCSCGVKKVAEICADPYTDLTAIESGVYEVTEDWNRRADNG